LQTAVAVDGVVGVADADRVVGVAAGHHGGAAGGLGEVGPGPGGDQVVAAAAVDPHRAAAGLDGVGLVAADHDGGQRVGDALLGALEQRLDLAAVVAAVQLDLGHPGEVLADTEHLHGDGAAVVVLADHHLLVVG